MTADIDLCSNLLIGNPPKPCSVYEWMIEPSESMAQTTRANFVSQFHTLHHCFFHNWLAFCRHCSTSLAAKVSAGLKVLQLGGAAGETRGYGEVNRWLMTEFKKTNNNRKRELQRWLESTSTYKNTLFLPGKIQRHQLWSAEPHVVVVVGSDTTVPPRNGHGERRMGCSCRWRWAKWQEGCHLAQSVQMFDWMPAWADI